MPIGLPDALRRGTLTCVRGGVLGYKAPHGSARNPTVSGDDFGVVVFTVEMAALATALIVPPGLALALLLARWRGPGTGLVETLCALPLVLPPTAVGLVLLELFARRGVVGGWLASRGIEIAFTWKGVVLATAVMAFPLLVRTARVAFEEVDPRLVGIARTLGCGPLAAFFRVTLPLAWRGVVAGAVLAFARALGEFGATVMLAGNIPGRTQTLSLAIFSATQTGDDGRARALAAVTVGLAFVTLWTVELLVRRRERRP